MSICVWLKKETILKLGIHWYLSITAGRAHTDAGETFLAAFDNWLIPPKLKYEQ